VKVVNLKVGEVNIPEVRVTAVYDDELTDQLKASLDATGQLIPCLVVRTEEGIELVDGLHRLQEARARGDKTIPCVEVPGDSITAMLYNLTTNRLRGKTKVSELVMVIDHLVHKEGLDSDEIAKRTGLTRDYIERLWKISESAPMVREALDQEKIGVGVAYELARLPRHEQQEQAIATASTFFMTTAQVKDLVDQTLRLMQEIPPEEAPVTPAAPPPPACQGCGVTIETAMIRSILVCPGCFGILYEKGQEKARSTPAASEVETPAASS